MSRPRRENLLIAGPAGALEAILETPTVATPTPAAVALICHPHPLHGGTMDNKVVTTLARSFLAHGALALRFNFRGVGASAGVFDNGIGELDDAAAAAAHLRDRWPDAPFFLGGFSFGAAVAAQAAETLEPAALVTVALPIERLGAPSFIQPAAPWLLVHGSGDALIDVDALIDWLNELAPGPELDVVDGADHFFHGKLVELRSCVDAFLERQIMGSSLPSNDPGNDMGEATC